MIAVRILRDGAPLREAVFADLPVRIGRAPDSDFVIFDSSVSRVHAVLEQTEEGLRLRDAGSANGMHTGPARVESALVGPGLRCRLGTVEVEIEALSLDATQPLRPAEWKRFDQRRSTADHVRYLLFGLAGWLVSVVLAPAFWSPWEKTRAVTLLWHGLGVLIALPILSFLLLGVLKVVGRRVRMADTLLALAQVAWVAPVASVVAFALYYLLPLSAHAAAISLIGFLAFVAVIVHVAALRRMTPGRAFQVVWAVIAATVYVGFGAISSLATRRTGVPSVEYHVQRPLGSYTGPTRALDAYFDEIRGASSEAARAAEEVRVRQDVR